MLYFVSAKFQSFADEFVVEFYTSLSMIIHKTRGVRISSQNLIHFGIQCHPEKHLGTSIKYRRFKKNIYIYIY